MKIYVTSEQELRNLIFAILAKYERSGDVWFNARLAKLKTEFFVYISFDYSEDQIEQAITEFLRRKQISKKKFGNVRRDNLIRDISKAVTEYRTRYTRPHKPV